MRARQIMEREASSPYIPPHFYFKEPRWKKKLMAQKIPDLRLKKISVNVTLDLERYERAQSAGLNLSQTLADGVDRATIKPAVCLFTTDEIEKGFNDAYEAIKTRLAKNQKFEAQRLAHVWADILSKRTQALVDANDLLERAQKMTAAAAT